MTRLTPWWGPWCSLGPDSLQKKIESQPCSQLNSFRLKRNFCTNDFHILRHGLTEELPSDPHTVGQYFRLPNRVVLLGGNDRRFILGDTASETTPELIDRVLTGNLSTAAADRLINRTGQDRTAYSILSRLGRLFASTIHHPPCPLRVSRGPIPFQWDINNVLRATFDRANGRAANGWSGQLHWMPDGRRMESGNGARNLFHVQVASIAEHEQQLNYYG